MYKTVIKPFLDSLFALIAVALFSPVLLVVMASLYWANKGKVFFVQERPGYKTKSFFLIKFKSMTDEKDSLGNLLPDKDRLTKVGMFIRKTSLDELPQLINVLKGDMSFVGPRPLLVRYLDHYTKEQMRRHDVKPGITGLAQVNGRNALSWDQKFKFDLQYVNEQSFMLDLRIMLKTFLKVVKTEDINSGKNETMKPFDQIQ